ncbi:MAG: hypothetical protein ABIN67_02815, partial [Ferruginibacter sp.]
ADFPKVQFYLYNFQGQLRKDNGTAEPTTIALGLPWLNQRGKLRGDGKGKITKRFDSKGKNNGPVNKVIIGNSRKSWMGPPSEVYTGIAKYLKDLIYKMQKTLSGG